MCVCVRACMRACVHVCVCQLLYLTKVLKISERYYRYTSLCKVLYIIFLFFMQGSIYFFMQDIIYIIIIIIIIRQTYNARNVIITIKYYKTNLRHGVCKVIYASLC